MIPDDRPNLRSYRSASGSKNKNLHHKCFLWIQVKFCENSKFWKICPKHDLHASSSETSDKLIRNDRANLRSDRSASGNEGYNFIRSVVDKSRWSFAKTQKFQNWPKKWPPCHLNSGTNINCFNLFQEHPGSQTTPFRSHEACQHKPNRISSDSEYPQSSGPKRPLMS